MELLDNILKHLRKDYGLEGPLTQEELQNVAHRHIDPDISPFIRSIWLEGNILVIQCTEPVVVQEFQARADGLVKRINRDVGRAALARVRLTLSKRRGKK